MDSPAHFRPDAPRGEVFDRVQVLVAMGARLTHWRYAPFGVYVGSLCGLEAGYGRSPQSNVFSEWPTCPGCLAVEAAGRGSPALR